MLVRINVVQTSLWDDTTKFTHISGRWRDGRDGKVLRADAILSNFELQASTSFPHFWQRHIGARKSVKYRGERTSGSENEGCVVENN